MSFIGLSRKMDDKDDPWSAALGAARFATREEARNYLWSQNWEAREYSVIENHQPPTHVYDNGRVFEIISDPPPTERPGRPKKRQLREIII